VTLPGMGVGLITPHFSWVEARCHDGTPVPMELQGNAWRVALMAERIRAQFSGAVIPVSWYRTPEYNARIGGAPHSRHCQADAIDGRPAHLAALPGLVRCIEDMLRDLALPELGGLGVYPGWVHIDCRPRPADGHVARWQGAGVGAELAT
jgi:hypothetical protein